MRPATLHRCEPGHDGIKIAGHADRLAGLGRLQQAIRVLGLDDDETRNPGGRERIGEMSDHRTGQTADSPLQEYVCRRRCLGERQLLENFRRHHLITLHHAQRNPHAAAVARLRRVGNQNPAARIGGRLCLADRVIVVARCPHDRGAERGYGLRAPRADTLVQKDRAAAAEYPRPGGNGAPVIAVAGAGYGDPLRALCRCRLPILRVTPRDPVRQRSFAGVRARRRMRRPAP